MGGEEAPPPVEWKPGKIVIPSVIHDSTPEEEQAEKAATRTSQPAGPMEASGLKWKSIGKEKPETGKEMTSAPLLDALKGRLKDSLAEFTQEEWESVSIGLKNLMTNDFAKVGDEYLMPTDPLHDVHEVMRGLYTHDPSHHMRQVHLWAKINDGKKVVDLPPGQRYVEHQTEIEEMEEDIRLRKSYNLAGLSLDDEDLQVWCYIMMHHKGCTHLTEMSLSNNKITDAGAAFLAEAIEKGAMPKLEQLYIGRNQIGDAGLNAIIQAMHTAKTNIKALRFSHNLIGDEGATSLAQLLTLGGLPSLAEIWMSENNIGQVGQYALQACVLDGGMKKVKPKTFMITGNYHGKLGGYPEAYPEGVQLPLSEHNASHLAFKKTLRERDEPKGAPPPDGAAPPAPPDAPPKPPDAAPVPPA